MPTTTTSQLIREDRRDIIEALTPAQLSSVKFREYDDRTDFRTWAEANPKACLRRFQVRDLSTYEVPLISSLTREETTTTYEVVVAFPSDGRYGSDQINGLEDAIRADQSQIADRIGAMAYQNYVGGLRLFELEDTEIERGENVYFSVSTYTVNYRRNLRTPKVLSASGTISMALTVTGTETLETGASWDGTMDGLTPEHVATILSQPAPTWMFKYNGNGSISELVSDAGDMTDVGTPVNQQTSTNMGGTVQLHDSGLDGMLCADSSVGDFAAESFAVMHLYQPKTGLTSGYMIGKLGNGDSYHWHIRNYSSHSRMLATASGGGLSLFLSNTNAQLLDTAVVGLLTSDNNANTSALRLGSRSVTGVSVSGTLANGTGFGIGDAVLGWAANTPMEHGVTMMWKGSDAEGFGETERALMESALGWGPQ